MTDCDRTLPGLEARRRGRLAGAEAAALEAHLAGCEACRALADAARVDALLDAPVAAEVARADWAAIERAVAIRRATLRRTFVAMLSVQLVLFPLVVWLAPAPGERGRLALGLGAAFALMLAVHTSVAALARRRLARLAARGELLPDLRTWLARRVRRLWVLRFALAGFLATFALRAYEDPHPPHRVLWIGFAATMAALLVFVQAVALPRTRRERDDLGGGGRA